LAILKFDIDFGFFLKWLGFCHRVKFESSWFANWLFWGCYRRLFRFKL